MSDLATSVTVIDACGRARVPVLLLFDRGMGKSSLVRGLAAAEGMVVCETALRSVREPADVAGMPVVTDQGAMIEPPARVTAPSRCDALTRRENATAASGYGPGQLALARAPPSPGEQGAAALRPDCRWQVSA